MGLLDDAIRDHLDLKRVRGGDPTEIERAEHEALGPVRRDPFERVPGDSDGVSVPDEGPRAYDREEDSDDDARREAYAVEEEWEEHEKPLGAGEPAAPPSYPTEAGAGDETMQYDVEEAPSEPAAAKRAPEWVEQSEEWVEQSGEWVEASHPVEPPAADLGAAESGRESAYLEPPDDEAAPGAPPHQPRSQRPAKPKEDVLNETPEFPQDAPDHDRLWFEQRPPRDFDFDG